MAVLDNDPRPVLRQELSRVFKNPRVVRAFEKIFDLIPPEFINQQVQIDALTLISELATAQSVAAVDAINQLTGAIERLAVAPPVQPMQDLSALLLTPPTQQISDVVNLSSYPALDTTIAVTWTGVHAFAAGLSATGTLAVTGNITATTTIAATGAISGSNLAAAGGANPSASLGLTAVNGSAITYMRSDAAPALNQAISPTWTNNHTFQAAPLPSGSVALGSAAARWARIYVSEIWDGASTENLLDSSGTTVRHAAGSTWVKQSFYAAANETFNLVNGKVGFVNHTSAAAATAGAATALPALPVGYLVVAINGTDRKIPYYAT